MQDSDWEGSEPQFNAPTSRLLGPKQAMTFGLRLFTAPSLRERDETLIATGVAVAQAVPGEVLSSALARPAEQLTLRRDCMQAILWLWTCAALSCACTRPAAHLECAASQSARLGP